MERFTATRKKFYWSWPQTVHSIP